MRAARRPATTNAGRMQVSFIIPLYNCLAHSRECLRTLRATLPAGLEHEIILVDDGSIDGTREWLQTLTAPCRVLLNERNLGFARTCNRGADAALGEWLVFLNNDLVLLPGWFEPLLAAAATPQVGVVGNIQLRVADGTVDHAGIRVLPDGKIAHERPASLIAAQRRAVEFVPAVTAACCLVPRALFQNSGGFDPAFVNGGEDVDFCFRLRRSGHRACVATRSVVQHHVSAARGPTNERDERNSRLLAERWREELISFGALTWARGRIDQHLSRPWTRDGREALALLPFALGLTPRPPVAAREVLISALHREETRWARLFDGANVPARDSRPAPAGQVAGFLRDEVDLNSVWLHRRATLELPAGFPTSNLFLSGFLFEPPADRPESDRPLGIRLTVNRRQVVEFRDLPPGNFNLGVDAPFALPDRPTLVEVELIGVGWTNFLAWAGQIARLLPKAWPIRRAIGRYRRQALNRRLRLARIVADDVVVVDFGRDPVLGQ